MNNNSHWEEAIARVLPDFVIRFGIRQRLKGLLANEIKATITDEKIIQQRELDFVEYLKQQEICLPRSDEAALEQHYEVPTAFFKLVMGEYMKYSCCLYPNGHNENTYSLSDAESSMLELVCERAEIEDNNTILDVGCGWGSFTLFALKKYPHINVVALSNSNTQKEYIINQARCDQTIDRLQVVTANIATYENDDFLNKFDRIVSNEMFEHMKNYELLMEKLYNWLEKDGKMFIHIFVHKNTPYNFNDGDWMADLFFQGGTMPSFNLLQHFQQHFKLDNQWFVNGCHYKYTAEAWLKNMDKKEHSEPLKGIMTNAYGKDNAKLWIVRWRLFFLACAELFGYNNGNEWHVGHYLFSK